MPRSPQHKAFRSGSCPQRLRLHSWRRPAKFPLAIQHRFAVFPKRTRIPELCVFRPRDSGSGSSPVTSLSRQLRGLRLEAYVCWESVRRRLYPEVEKPPRMTGLGCSQFRLEIRIRNALNFDSVPDAEVASGGNDATHPNGHHERPPLPGACRCTYRFYWVSSIQVSSGIPGFLTIARVPVPG